MTKKQTEPEEHPAHAVEAKRQRALAKNVGSLPGMIAERRKARAKKAKTDRAAAQADWDARMAALRPKKAKKAKA